MICIATKQELTNARLSILWNCTVAGCCLPFAQYRDDAEEATAPVPVNLPSRTFPSRAIVRIFQLIHIFIYA